MTTRLARLFAIVCVTALAPSSDLRAREQSAPSALEARLVAMLNATAVNWNQGDLDGFIAPYDDSATYMTTEGPIHRADIRRHYETKYFAAGVKRRTLHYDQLSVRPMGDEYALMIGRYVLEGGAAPPKTGRFTLVWGKTAGAWRILHDHSS